MQMGARMHYAIPAILARNNMLARVYLDTDMRNGTLPKILRMCPESLRPKPLRRLAAHRLPDDIPPGSVRAFPMQAILAKMGLSNFEQHVRREALKDGFDCADALYSYINGDLPVAREASRRGLSIVH